MNKLIQVQRKNLENTEKSIDDRITENEKRLQVLEKGLQIPDLLGQSDDIYTSLAEFVKSIHVFVGDQLKEQARKDTALNAW